MLFKSTLHRVKYHTQRHGRRQRCKLMGKPEIRPDHPKMSQPMVTIIYVSNIDRCAKVRYDPTKGFFIVYYANKAADISC